LKEGNAPVSEAAAADGEDFRVVSITSVRAPSGCEGRDWLLYRIAQGTNIITGYRRGDLDTANAEVEKIVTSLNERRRSSKAKAGRKAGQRAAAEAPAKEEPE
jgi:transposase InsO family protein